MDPSIGDAAAGREFPGEAAAQTPPTPVTPESGGGGGGAAWLLGIGALLPFPLLASLIWREHLGIVARIPGFHGAFLRLQGASVAMMALGAGLLAVTAGAQAGAKSAKLAEQPDGVRAGAGALGQAYLIAALAAGLLLWGALGRMSASVCGAFAALLALSVLRGSPALRKPLQRAMLVAMLAAALSFLAVAPIFSA